MKLSAIWTVASAAVVAAATGLEKRQFFIGGTQNDLINNTTCKAAMLIYARGATEMGNTGMFFLDLLPMLKSAIPDLGVQGVGYRAGLMTANKEKGTTDEIGIREAARLFNLAAEKCPQTAILGSGWSLGAAIIRNALPLLPKSTLNKIAGVVTFADVQYHQNNHTIPGIPVEKGLIICQPLDPTCSPAADIVIGGRTMQYLDYYPQATNFMAEKVKAYKNQTAAKATR